jgi:cytochrome P450
LSFKFKTSNASQWVLYSLATNPEEQEKIYQQVMEVTKGETVTSETLKKLSLVKGAVTEALRVNIVVPATNRILNDDITLAGYNIPARVCLNFTNF